MGGLSENTVQLRLNVLRQTRQWLKAVLVLMGQAAMEQGKHDNPYCVDIRIRALRDTQLLLRRSINALVVDRHFRFAGLARGAKIDQGQLSV